jgi:hypothetical protein
LIFFAFGSILLQFPEDKEATENIEDNVEHNPFTTSSHTKLNQIEVSFMQEK